MNNHELIPTLIGAVLLIALVIAFLEANKAKNKAKRRKINNDRTIPNNYHDLNGESYYNHKP